MNFVYDFHKTIQMSIRYIHTIIWSLNVKIFPIFNYLKLWSTQSVKNRLLGLYASYRDGEEMQLYIPDLKFKPMQDYKFKTHATIIRNDIDFASSDGTKISMFTFKTNFMLLTPLSNIKDDYDPIEYTFQYRL